jgi:voltage-dependent potassium channel beta subunit
MQYRRLGHSGLKVSSIALGGWINYGEGKVDEGAARRVIERAYELGVNYYDLADVYGQGAAESQMGAVLKRLPRHTLVIASKVFWPMSDDVNDRGLSRKHIFESVHKSLRRLSTDYLDLYFCHRYDPETPVEETVRAMDDLVRQGKVLYWGTSEWTAAQIEEAHAVCARHGFYRPLVEQPQYSLLAREPVEGSVLPTAQARGMGLVVWSPLAMGMLTGKYDGGIPRDSRFAREDWARERFLNEANVARVQRLKPIADQLGLTRAQLALAWALRNETVSSVIIGATRPDQVDENVGAAAASLSAEVCAAIEQAMA